MTAPVWVVHYQLNGDRSAPRTRLLASLHDALTAACALRARHTVVQIEGPNAQTFDEAAIAKWCADRMN